MCTKGKFSSLKNWNCVKKTGSLKSNNNAFFAYKNGLTQDMHITSFRTLTRDLQGPGMLLKSAQPERDKSKILAHKRMGMELE
jgi:hypothetical protein